MTTRGPNLKEIFYTKVVRANSGAIQYLSVLVASNGFATLRIDNMHLINKSFAMFMRFEETYCFLAFENAMISRKFAKMSRSKLRPYIGRLQPQARRLAEMLPAYYRVVSALLLPYTTPVARQ